MINMTLTPLARQDTVEIEPPKKLKKGQLRRSDRAFGNDLLKRLGAPQKKAESLEGRVDSMPEKRNNE